MDFAIRFNLCASVIQTYIKSVFLSHLPCFVLFLMLQTHAAECEGFVSEPSQGVDADQGVR